MTELVIAAAEKLRRIPDRYRKFNEPEDVLTRKFGISSNILTELLDLGMPHAGRSSARLFDAIDLHNIGIDMQLPSPKWSALRLWAKAFASSDGFSLRKVIGVYAECCRLHAGDSCEFTLDEVFRTHPSVSNITMDSDEFLLTLNVPPAKRRLVKAIGPLVDRARELTFHLLCNELASDVTFVADTGLANCQLAALELARVGQESGIPVRKMSGLFVAAPFPSRHAWIQVLNERAWTSIDPFMISTMVRWRIVDPREWPPSRSPAAFLLGLHESFQPLVWDCGFAAKEHFRTA